MSVQIVNVRDMEHIQADVKFAIMRSYKYKVDGVINMPDLSPSSTLFDKYLRWVREGNWNRQTFLSQYLPEFMRDTLCAAAGREALVRILHMDQIGLRVALGCSCSDEELCHRSIVAGVLFGHGCSLITQAGRSYSYYYNYYTNNI